MQQEGGAGAGRPGPAAPAHTAAPRPACRPQGCAQTFAAPPAELHGPGPAAGSPVLSGSCSSGISSLSRCSTSEASGFENAGSEPPAQGPGPGGGPDEPKDKDGRPPRKDSRTPPPYSVYERTLRRPVPLPHSLSVPAAAEPPALPPKPPAARHGHLENGARRTEPGPRPRPLPRKVSQL